MNMCCHIQAELSAYIDNEVSTATRTLVEEHVRDCRHCRERLAELKTLAAGVTALPGLRPAPQFLAEVRRKLACDERPRPKLWQDFLFRPLWLKVPLEALAVLVVVALVMRFERPMNGRARAALPAEKPASAPVVAGGEPHLINKLVPSRPVGSASPLISTTGLQQQPVTEVVVVHAKDFNDARSRVQQFAVALNGRVVLPPDQKAPAQTLFVELPQENVAPFKSLLLHARGRTGTPVQDQLAAEPKEIGKKAVTTILEIQVVPD